LDGVVALGVVQDTAGAPNPLFVFAATTDRAAVYIAGGSAATNTNTVLSAAVTAANPAQAFAIAANAISCGANDSPIVALAPGGGVALLFVGKTKELGEIAEVIVAGASTPSAIYKTLLPYDSSLATNSQGLGWWMGSGSDAQRGPTVLRFNRDRSPWTYTPNTQDAGQAQNIAPWAKHGFRPPTIRGKATAFQGTARWLYYAITRGDGRSWIMCADSSVSPSGPQRLATNPLFDLGINACQTLGITSLFGTNPLLFFGYGNGIAQITLPLDGENPLDDSSCRFGSSGTLTMPDIDLNFPDEDKVAFTIRMVHDQVSPGAQDIQAQISLDGGAFTTLGSAGTGNGSSVSFPTSTLAKRITPRFVLTTIDPTKTPILVAFSVRVSINNVLYREWIMQCQPVVGTLQWGGEDRQNVYTMLSAFWSARKSGLPFPFTDVWQDKYVVRLLRFKVKHVRHSIGRAPEMIFWLHLLEVAPGAGNLVYGNSLATYGAITSKYG
jgi:hypothetical protein